MGCGIEVPLLSSKEARGKRQSFGRRGGFSVFAGDRPWRGFLKSRCICAPDMSICGQNFHFFTRSRLGVGGTK